MFGRIHLLAIALVLGTAGCFVPLAQGPRDGIEGTEDTCHDHIDNDGNHMTDCRDPRCIEHGFCNQIIPLSVYIQPEGRMPGTDCWRHTRTAIVQSQTPDQLRASCLADPSGRCVYFPPVTGTSSVGDCSITVDPTRELVTCDDQIDNDDDGHFDCGDTGCSGIYETCCNVEVTNELCRNLVDDDGNGFADCQENTCKHPQYDFITACTTETWPGQPNNCRNHLDDDRDHYIDCADKECLGDPLCVEDCTNGVDDNADGRVDCLDPRCFGMPGPIDAACTAPTDMASCTAAVGTLYFAGMRDQCAWTAPPMATAYCHALCPTITESTDALCTDGLDNDGNEYIDCADRSCAATARCQLEHTRMACSDGIDNDGNGYIDCSDFSCTRTSSGALQEAVDYCNNFIALYGEANFARCTDGVDNDNNGYVDCADFSCIKFTEVDPNSPASAPVTRSPCQESIGGDAYANCTDGRDNDADGFVDCEDWDCNYNPAMLVPDPGDPHAPMVQYCALHRAMFNPPQPLVCGSY
jgi:hypothetical protein